MFYHYTDTCLMIAIWWPIRRQCCGRGCCGPSILTIRIRLRASIHSFTFI